VLRLEQTARVWLVLGRTDMRKAINGLSALVATSLNLDPMSGQYFVFCGRRRDTLKILYYDQSGYALWQKMLEAGIFRWPKNGEEARAITGEQLGWLLSGLDMEQAHRPQRYSA
jgi:transposase